MHPVRLIATDLDGTLLHTDGSVTPRTRDALAAAEAAGIDVVFVTGRPLRWAREVFGHTIKDMLLDRRLLEAKRLLLFTIRPVEDIGREVGFEDPAYFSRFFRKRVGEAPAAWRRRNLERDLPGKTSRP